MSGARRARGHRPRGVRAGSGFAGGLFTCTAPLGAIRHMARAPVNVHRLVPPLRAPQQVTHGRRRSTSGRTGALLYTYPNTRSRVVRDEFLGERRDRVRRDRKSTVRGTYTSIVNDIRLTRSVHIIIVFIRYTKTVGGVFRVIVWFLSRRPGNLRTLTCVVPL